MHRGVNGEDTKPIIKAYLGYKIKAQKSRMVQQDTLSYNLLVLYYYHPPQIRHGTGEDAPSVWH